MAADAWVIHDAFKERMADGTLDLDNDTFKVGLFLSTSNAATTSVNNFASLTNEHGTTNTGYTAGGNTLSGVTWAQTSGTATFDSDNTSWTAGTAGLSPRFAVLYDDTDASKTVVAHSLLDNTPADVSVASGNVLNVNMNASGIFTLS